MVAHALCLRTGRIQDLEADLGEARIRRKTRGADLEEEAHTRRKIQVVDPEEEAHSQEVHIPAVCHPSAARRRQ